MTARTRCGWLRHRECGELLYGRRFSLRLNVAVVTARTRCGWVGHRECGELQYGRRFPLRLNGAVCESYVRPAMLYGSETLCLGEGVRW